MTFVINQRFFVFKVVCGIRFRNNLDTAKHKKLFLELDFSYSEEIKEYQFTLKKEIKNQYIFKIHCKNNFSE